jgi:hypothetical protein
LPALLLTLLPSLAVAADAEGLLREGIALRRVGKDVAALKKFEEANAAQPSARAVAQIGFAEQALGRWGVADRHLRAALAASNDPWVGKNRRSIDQALEMVAQHVGRLEIIGSPAGGEVLVDGESVGQLPLGGPIAATAGGVAIEVRAPGYVSVVRSARIAVGGLTRESFNLQPAAASGREPTAGAAATRHDGATPASAAAIAHAPPEPTDAVSVTVASSMQARPGEPQPTASIQAAASSASSGGMPAGRIAALVAAGLSAGALATGIYEHVQWQDRVSSFKEDMTCNLDTPGRGSTTCQSLYDDGQKARTLTFVGYGFAGAFAATAVVLYLVSPETSSNATAVACGLEPGSLGLTCAGRF